MINIHDAKTHFSKLVRLAAEGEETIIARGGEPMARLGPLDAPESRSARVPHDPKDRAGVSEDCWDPNPDMAILFQNSPQTRLGHHVPVSSKAKSPSTGF